MVKTVWDTVLIDAPHLATPVYMTNETKRILYLITKSNLGGAQKYVYELAVEAKERGHDVTVALGGTGKAGAATGPLADKLREADIAVIEVRSFMRSISLLRDIRAFFEVGSIIRHVRPDVLHVTSSKAGGIGGFVGRILFVPRIIFTSHGLTMDERWRPFYERFLITLFTWLTMALCHVTIMINTDTLARAKRLPLVGRKAVCIFNGIRPREYFDRTTARETLNLTLPHDAVLLGGVGELHPNKNWSAAIEALTHLSPRVHLIIFGEGEERTALESHIASNNLSSRVHLMGYHDAAPRLPAFDIFILPSKKEGLPYVLLEAGLARLPVIASDLPGNHDIINHGTSGILVSPTPVALADAISKLIDNDALKLQLGTALYEHVTTTFTMNEMFASTFATYSTNT